MMPDNTPQQDEQRHAAQEQDMRTIEHEAIQRAARRERERVDAEDAGARMDRNMRPSTEVGRDGVKVTGGKIFARTGEDAPPPSTRFFDYWDNGVLRQIAVHVD